MNKLITAVVLTASCLFLEIHAQPSLYTKSDKQALDAWVLRYYRPLLSQSKQMLVSTAKAHLSMLESYKNSLRTNNDLSLLMNEAKLLALKLWNSNAELMKEQTTGEVIDVARALNALNQLRLDWYKKVIAQFQQEGPTVFERVVVGFSQKGQFKLYRELYSLSKWANEIADQFILFERELAKSF